MQTTKLLYLDDFITLESDAKIVTIDQEPTATSITLDQTIFYPQGGGQPTDIGVIENDSGKFTVESVRNNDGIVKHNGRFEQGNFQVGDIVHCSVNQMKRELHNRLHSGGHVVDMAIHALNLNWIPAKGYHFPDGPYVEYQGSLEGIDKEKFKSEVENLVMKFIKEDHETKVVFIEKDKLHTLCHNVPDYLPANRPVRVVMYGSFGVPCGGTHVNSLSQIKSMSIRKIKQNGDYVRVSYDVER